MIKFTSFYPFSNFMRVTQEFYEDNAVVKIKSLTSEHEFEFEYKDVVEISDTFIVSGSQNNFSFWLLCFVSSMITIFHKEIYNYIFLVRMAQILYVSALILYTTSFIKSWHINFTDKNDNFLTSIKQTRYNHNLIEQVVEKIKNTSKNIREILVTNPFPEGESAFEHITYEDLNTKKTIERFYENEVVSLIKGISGECVYTIKYSQLNGKTYHGKVGDDSWGMTLTISTLIISTVSGFFFGFRVDLSLGLAYLYTTAVLFGILLIITVNSFALIFVKQEVVGLYDMNGNIVYRLQMNRTNKKKIEEIIKYIQSKIPAENKD